MPASAWICSSCTRRVPRTVDVCRCGHEWTGSEEAVADPQGDRFATTAVAGSAIVLIAAVIAFIAIGRSGRLATPARPALGAPESAEAIPSPAAESDSRVPQWPTDPTLWKDSPTPGPPAVSAPQVASGGGALGLRSLEDVISASLPAVALVETPGGRGTGFFVAPDTLVTNAHVVEGNAYVTIKLSTGETLSGRVTQRSDDLDLAAIRTNDSRPGQATLALASSREVRIGQEVIAIGSPLGLQNTVTRGIVSALRQVGSVVLVQTDAAINPGNSGGPLLDRSGRVLAVATMRMGGRAEALGFGVGAEHVRAMLDGRAPQSAQTGQRPADLFAPGRAEGTDDDRETGEAAYERFLVEVGKRADQLDSSWTDFVADCLSGRAPSTRSDRAWYALWEKFDDTKVSPACTRFVADFKTAAREFERRMTEAADRARAVGVYPGVCRQLRQRHRLDSPNW
ncbi:MAG: trypsin-like peptidase domain-containing protein [Vicinamibacteria bacterium]|nr:trypsin-like peptidase domain-containing protein [Vicinamibacteria bacterium]